MKEGWTYKRLGEVCNIDYGTRVVRSRDAGSMYPVYGGGGATFSIDSYNREDCMIVSRFAMSEQCTRFVKGKFFLNDSGLSVSTKDDKLNQSFLDWQIFSLNNTIYKLGRGAAQKNLDTKAFGELKIKYPCLDDQQRIVFHLDRAFAFIDKLKAKAEKQLSDAKALFQRALTQAMEPKEGWEEKTLGEVCNVVGGGTPDTKNKDYWSGNIPWATVSDMNCDVLKSTGYYITEKGLNESSSRIIKTGEIIIATRVGLGKVCKLAVDTAINQDLKGIIPKENNILRDFIFYYFKDKATYIVDNGIGATVKGVKIKFIEGLSFHVPPLSEQQAIVSRLDELSENVKELEKILEKTIKECDALKQAILREVFE